MDCLQWGSSPKTRTFNLADRATAHGSQRFKNGLPAKLQDKVSEAALSHKPRDRVEAAYRRANYLEERIGLMERWTAYCVS